MIKCTWLCALMALVLAAGCSTAPQQPTLLPTAPAIATATASPPPPGSNPPAPFELTSPAFENGGVIPKQFACTGSDISPELNWGDPPSGTQTFALIFDDPTFSPGWVHWIVYNIPADARNLPENVSPGDQLTDGGLHGANSRGRLDYGGPCPPEGTTHTYVFSLYALDEFLDLEPGASKQELLAAMEGHVLAQIDLRASFTR